MYIDWFRKRRPCRLTGISLPVLASVNIAALTKTPVLLLANVQEKVETIKKNPNNFRAEMWGKKKSPYSLDFMLFSYY